MVTVIDPFGNQIQIDFQSGITINQVLEKAQVVLNRLDIVLMDQKKIILPPFETEVQDKSIIRVLRIVSGG